MSHPNFNLLNDLAVLLKEGSVVAAAKQLNISAPAMSRRLAQLRTAFDDPLFVTSGRGLVPTKRALSLHQQVQTLVEDMKQIFVPSSIDLKTEKRTLTLRANNGFIGVWAIKLMKIIKAQAPNIVLRFIPRTQKTVDALRNGLVDLDIGVRNPAVTELYTQILFRTLFSGVIRGDHPLTKAEIDINSFVEWPHISVSRRGYMIGPVDTALAERNLIRNVSMIVPDFQSALAIVAASDYIATIPEPFARWAASFQPFHIFPMPVKTPEIEISQSWHPRQHADPLHIWLREQVRLACA